jgi:hypothetical protein
MYTRIITEQAELIVDYMQRGGRDGAFIALHAKTISELAKEMLSATRLRSGPEPSVKVYVI